MIQLYQNCVHLRVLKFFFDHPYEEFHLRGLARELRMDPMTLKRKLGPLIEDGLIIKREERGFHLFKANVEDIRFLSAKKSFTVSFLVGSGLVDRFLRNGPSLASIVLFGSLAKGTDGPDSDIDILLVASRKYEGESPSDIGGRKLNFVSVTPAEWSLIYQKNKPFYDEVMVNGIALYGRKPVV